MQLKAKKAAAWLAEGHRVKVDLFLWGRYKYMEFASSRSGSSGFLSLSPQDYKLADPIAKSPKGLATVLERAKKQQKRKIKAHENKQIIYQAPQSHPQRARLSRASRGKTTLTPKRALGQMNRRRTQNLSTHVMTAKVMQRYIGNPSAKSRSNLKLYGTRKRRHNINKRRKNILAMTKGYRFGRSTKKRAGKGGYLPRRQVRLCAPPRQKERLSPLWNVRINGASTPWAAKCSLLLLSSLLSRLPGLWGR
jgi:ribosomal protein L20